MTATMLSVSCRLLLGLVRKRSSHYGDRWTVVVFVVLFVLLAAVDNELPMVEGAAYHARILSTTVAPSRQRPWRTTPSSSTCSIKTKSRLSFHHPSTIGYSVATSSPPHFEKMTCSSHFQLLARRSTTQEEQPSTTSSSSTTPTPTTEQEVEGEEEPLISELDARVLRSMLQDQDKLDLGQEENMKRLLERGIAPKTASSPKRDNNTYDEADADSEYSSQVFKKLTDTKLWKVLRRTTEDLLESAKIFVINRVERDAKLLASVGLFAWDRAVRDVARALPAASSKARVAVGLLTNSSSTTTASDIDSPVDVFEELNTPLDEIKSVTQAISDILSGDITTTTGGSAAASSSRRRLRTLAPGGQVNNAERQRRAYERRKKTTLQDEKEVIPNIGKVVGGFADATWEMKRELQVESSQPGYKTENLRNAIEAGASQTGKLLQAVKEDGWTRALLSPLKRQKIERQLKAAVASQAPEQQSSASSTIPVEFLLNLLEERTRVASRLKKCIEQPEATWLNVEVIQKADGGVQFEEQNLRAVVETMIQTRDEIKTMVEATTKKLNNDQLSIPGIFEELRQVQRKIDEIQSKASQLIAPVVGDALLEELVGRKEATGNEPILLTLVELEDIVINSSVQQSVQQVEANGILASSTVVTTRSPPAAPKESSSSSPRVVVDVMPEADESARRSNFWQRRKEEVDDNEDDEAIASFQVEIVTDDDMNGATVAGSATKTVEAVSEDTQDEEKPNFFLQATLRSFDIVFFVLEKVVLVAVPKLFKVGKTMSTRIDEVSRSGLGRKGWQRIGFTEEGVRRY